MTVRYPEDHAAGRPAIEWKHGYVEWSRGRGGFRPEPWVNAWWYQRDRRAAATARGPDPDHVDVRPQHVGAWEVVADEESKDGQLPLIGGTWLDRQVPRLPGHVTTLRRLRAIPAT